MYKLIFIDIDGTLRNSKREISQRSINIIKKLKDIDIKVVLASGQSVGKVQNISEQCGASEYIIASSGAEVINCKTNEEISVSGLSIDNCQKIYELCEENKVGCILHIGNELLLNNYNFNIDNSNIKCTIIKSNIVDHIKEQNKTITQCVILDTNIEKILKIKNEIDKMNDVKIINQSKCLTNNIFPLIDHCFIDIAALDASKGNAASKLANYLNIPLNDTIAIGDDRNDIELFKMVGYSVAMGNAIPAIKDIANYITLSNDNDGVAVFLEKLYSDIK